MKSRNVFWGVILVLTGVLFFLKNFDIIYFSWRDIFHLWPLVLVLIGISILPVKTTVKLILTVIAILFTLLILYFSPGYWRSCSWIGWQDKQEYHDEHWSSQSFEEPFNDETEVATLAFDAVAGSFEIAGYTSELFEFEKEGNIGPYESMIEISNNEVKVKIVLEEHQIFSGNIRNKARFSLNANPLWELDLDIGAARVEMDLSQYRVRKIKIDGGAASIDIKLGDRCDNTIVKVNTGASAVKILIPENVACEIDTDTFLSSTSLNGFNKVGKNTYVSENFADCEKNISIELDSAISSFKVVRY